jgi:signal transduction histidine kinase
MQHLRLNNKLYMYRIGLVVAWMFMMPLFLSLVIHSELSRIENEFSVLAANLQSHINNKARIFETSLEGFANYLAVMPDLDLERARHFVRLWRERYPDIYVMEISRRITNQERSSFEREMRDAGHKNFTIHTFGFDTDQASHPSVEKDVYYPIIFREPELPEADDVMGLDLSETSSILNDALRRSFRENKMVASRPFDLIQGIRGYVMYRPVSTSMQGPALELSLEHELYGLVVVDASSLIPDWARTTEGLSLSLRYGNQYADVDSELAHFSNPAGNSIGLDYFIDPIVKKVVIDNISQPFELALQYKVSWDNITKELLYISLVASLVTFIAAWWFSNMAAKREIREIKLRESRDVAEEAYKMKSEFLSNISHELRTPLNDITGFCGLLQRLPADDMSANAHEYIDYITRSGKHLNELIEQVLDFSRIDVGMARVEPEQLNVTELVEECMSAMRPMAYERRVVLSTECRQTYAANSDDLFCTDRTRLRQVLLNLISNAIKYNKQDGKVCVSTVCNKDGVVIEVHDTGIGIDKGDSVNIFQPFTRLQEHGAVEGSGIGLAVTEKNIELLGGTIVVESQPGKGTCFRVTLPTMVVPERYIKRRNTSFEAERRYYEPLDCTVLYVEDNAIAMRFIEVLVADIPQLCLLKASSGNEALTIAAEKQPNLVITDINLPDISGIELAKALAEQPRTRTIPVIAISADLTQVNHDNDQLFHSFMAKPVTLDSLYDNIRSAIYSRQLHEPV